MTVRILIVLMVVLSVSGFLYATGPGGVSNGLILWLDASDVSQVLTPNPEYDPEDPESEEYILASDGDPVAIWKDKSSGENDAVQAVLAYRPVYKEDILYGKPVVRFDGVNDRLNAGNFLNVRELDQPLTLIVVLISETTSSATILCTQALNEANAAGFGFFYSAVADNSIVRFADGTRRIQVTLDENPFTGDRSFLVVRYDGSEDAEGIYHAVNGEDQSNVSHNQAVGDITNDGDTIIGARTDNIGGIPYEGDIAEIIIYDREITDEELEDIEAYIAQKYNIDIPGKIAIEPLGDGTENNPYKIGSLSNLYWIAACNDVVPEPDQATRWNSHYVQTDNINASDTQYWVDEHGYGGWEPIGWYYLDEEEEEQLGTFSGVYNGAGKTISNLFINRPDKDFIGLFGRMTGTSEQMAELKNIRLVGVDITGELRVGSLLGKIDDNEFVTITNCSAERNLLTGGTVRGIGTTGGLVGANNGFQSGNPAQRRSKMFFCYADIDVYYIGESEGTDIKIGGLVGCNQRGETFDSFALGNVNGTNGAFYAERVGGFTGCIVQGLTQRCFSFGTVTATGTDVGAFVGFVGAAGVGGVAPDCYYNSDANTLEGSGTPLTEAQFAVEANFPNYDFVNTWQMSINGYPELRANPISLIFTGNLFYVEDGDGLYANDNLAGQNVYASLKTDDEEDDYNINVTYTTNKIVLKDLPNDAMTAYWKFMTADFSILRNSAYLEIEMPGNTYDIWHRAVIEPDNSTEWTLVANYSEEDNIYKISIDDLTLPDETRSEGQGYIELVGFSGEAPDVDLLFISEISDNKAGQDAGTGFIELYNHDTLEVTLSGLQIRVGLDVDGTFTFDDGFVYTIPGGTTIGARGVLVIGNGANETTFKNAWGISGSINYLAGDSDLELTSGAAYQLYQTATRSGEIDSSPNVDANTRAVQIEIGEWEIGDVDDANPGGLAEGQTLPVELSSFTAIVTAEMFVQLEWTAETETNMLGYNVYRSKNDKLSDAVKANFIIIPAHNQSTARDYNYIDQEVDYGTYYYYWLQSNDLDLTHEFHGPVSVFVEDIGTPGGGIEVPFVTELKGSYPNPFNPGTYISFSLEERSDVTITIYNAKGQLIKTLIDNEEFSRSRNHRVYWDGRDYLDNRLSSGIYFYIMKVGDDFQEANKMIMMK